MIFLLKTTPKLGVYVYFRQWIPCSILHQKGSIIRWFFNIQYYTLGSHLFICLYRIPRLLNTRSTRFFFFSPNGFPLNLNTSLFNFVVRTHVAFFPQNKRGWRLHSSGHLPKKTKRKKLFRNWPHQGKEGGKPLGYFQLLFIPLFSLRKWIFLAVAHRCKKLMEDKQLPRLPLLCFSCSSAFIPFKNVSLRWPMTCFTELLLPPMRRLSF